MRSSTQQPMEIDAETSPTQPNISWRLGSFVKVLEEELRNLLPQLKRTGTTKEDQQR